MMNNLIFDVNVKIKMLNNSLKKLKELGGTPSNKSIMSRVKKEKKICANNSSLDAMQSLHNTLEVAIDCAFMDITIAQALKLGNVEKINITGLDCDVDQ